MVIRPTSAATEGGKLLRKPEIVAELARRRADLAARNGVKLDELIQNYKRVAFADIRKVIGSPGDRDEDTALAVQAYDAGGPQGQQGAGVTRFALAVSAMGRARLAIMEAWPDGDEPPRSHTTKPSGPRSVLRARAART